MFRLVRTIKFAFSNNPRSFVLKELEEELRDEIRKNDAIRGKGAMSYLVRGSYLLTREEVFARDREGDVIDI